MEPQELQRTIDEIVQTIVGRLASEFREKIESIFVAGSYATKTYSLQFPNVNLYVISKANESSGLFIPLSRVFHEIKEEFRERINITADLKPYRFACYTPQKDKVTLSVRINLFDMRDKARNFMVPDYVLRGWLKSQRILFGSDILKELKINVSTDIATLNQKRFILTTIMQQLKHMPLTYDWRKEPELLFSESYEFAKYTLSEGLLLKMSEKEIAEGYDVKIYEDKRKFVDFYAQKYGSHAADLARKVAEARESYLEWKDDLNKAIEMYTIAWQVWTIIWETLLKMLPPTR